MGNNVVQKRCFYSTKCHRVAPDYAADLPVPIMNRGRNANRKGDRLLDHVQCTVHVLT